MKCATRPGIRICTRESRELREMEIATNRNGFEKIRVNSRVAFGQSGVVNDYFTNVECGIFAALATACPPWWGESVSPRRPDMS
jgi:hypothetical protein